jgi:DNA-binding MarR family transcriptional regulator
LKNGGGVLMLSELITRDSSLYSQHLLGLVRHSLSMARQKELAPVHITPRQAQVLFILYNLGHKATLVELANHAGRGVSALSIQLTRMEKDGLVKKTRETPKSVQLKFQLTKKGIDTYKKSTQMTAYKKIISVLTEEERQQLISTLKKVLISSEKYQSEEFQSKKENMFDINDIE